MTTTPTPTATTTTEPAQQRGAVGNAWRIVTSREITVKLKDRTFLITTAVTLIVIIAAVVFQAIMASHESTKSIATTQAGSQIVKTAGTIADRGDGPSFDTAVKSSAAQVEKAVKDGKADAGLVPQGDGWRLLGNDSKDTDISTWIGLSVQQSAMQRNAEKAGTTLQELQRGSQLPYVLLDPDATDHGTAKVIGVAFGFLFYMGSLIFGLTIANSVIEEKQNRIVEILASAIPLRQLLIGKIAGNSVLAIAQLIIFSVVGIVGLFVTDNTSMLSHVTGGIVWFIIFYLVGFTTLACVWAVAGALATRSEDIQSTSTPISMVIIAVFIAGISVEGTAQVILSYLPLFSTITMPIRLVSGTAQWWEPLVALAIAVAAAYGIIRVADSMYRHSLMQTGRKLSYREAFRAKG